MFNACLFKNNIQPQFIRIISTCRDSRADRKSHSKISHSVFVKMTQYTGQNRFFWPKMDNIGTLISSPTNVTQKACPVSDIWCNQWQARRVKFFRLHLTSWSVPIPSSLTLTNYCAPLLSIPWYWLGRFAVMVLWIIWLLTVLMFDKCSHILL